MAGRWSEHFGREAPLVLELACGKGEYSLGLGSLYPQNNYLGIDQKGNRLWVGAKKARQQGLNNVAFLRIGIDRITEFFAPGEVSEIWITFPDPQLRVSKSKKRLTHPKFLRLYQQFLQRGGRIHLKTDSPNLYAFTKKVIDQYRLHLHEDIGDVYALPDVPEVLRIKTHYEALDIAGANRVHYLSFSLPEQLPGREEDLILQQSLKDEAGTHPG